MIGQPPPDTPTPPVTRAELQAVIATIVELKSSLDAILEAFKDNQTHLADLYVRIGALEAGVSLEHYDAMLKARLEARFKADCVAKARSRIGVVD